MAGLIRLPDATVHERLAKEPSGTVFLRTSCGCVQRLPAPCVSRRLWTESGAEVADQQLA